MRSLSAHDLARLTGLLGDDWDDDALLARSEELLMADVEASVPLADIALTVVRAARWQREGEWSVVLNELRVLV